MQIVALAEMQLWLAHDLAQAMPRSWEQYLPEAERETASPSTLQPA